MDLFSKFMNTPLSTAAVTHEEGQEAVWGLGCMKSITGLGSKPLCSREKGGPQAHVLDLQEYPGREGRQPPALQVDHEPPCATMQLERETWRLISVKGKPAWLKSQGATGQAVPE